MVQIFLSNTWEPAKKHDSGIFTLHSLPERNRKTYIYTYMFIYIYIYKDRTTKTPFNRWTLQPPPPPFPSALRAPVGPGHGAILPRGPPLRVDEGHRQTRRLRLGSRRAVSRNQRKGRPRGEQTPRLGREKTPWSSCMFNFFAFVVCVCIFLFVLLGGGL